MQRFWTLDVLSERLQMLRAATLLASASLCVLFVDTMTKWNMWHDLTETHSPALVSKVLPSTDPLSPQNPFAHGVL